MAIGFTAFVFKIYLNADSNFPVEYKDALEFSGKYLLSLCFKIIF